MQRKFLQIKTQNDITTLTFNRPEKHNAFNEYFIQELIETLNKLSNDSKVKCLIITANGENFSSGADLGWMKKMINYSKEENIQDALKLAELLNILASFPKPTIVCVQGKTFGGGIGLIACCDIAIAATNAQFCFSEIKLGLAPATIAPYVIQTIGKKAASYYFLTAQIFDAEAARDLGLIQKITTKKELNSTANEIATLLVQRSMPAIKTIKQLIRKNSPIDNKTHEDNVKLIAELRTTPEAQKLLKDFLEN